MTVSESTAERDVSRVPGAGWRPNLLTLSVQRTLIELKQFFRDTRSAVFTFALPVMLLVLLGGIFSLYKLDIPGHEMNFRQYFIAGMIGAGIIATTFNNLATWISMEQQEGLLKRLSATPLPRSAYFAGKIGMATTITVIQVALMLVIGVAAYGLNLPSDPARWGMFILVTVLGVSSCSLLGIGFTRFIPNARSAPSIIMPIYLVIEFISGVFFEFTQIPAWMQWFANIFPLRWMTLGYRYVFLPDWFKSQEVGGSWHVGTTIIVLAIWVVVAFIFCIRCFRWDRGISQ